MENSNEVVVSLGDEGRRFDTFLAECPGIYSRGQAQRLIKLGKALVDSKLRPKDYHLRVGERVVYEPPSGLADETVQPEERDLDIVFEDEDLLVVNKPSSLVVHPAPGNPAGTLVNALVAHTNLATIGSPLRPGIVHRLDKDTSGLMVVAKTDQAYMSLVSQIKDRRVSRKYLTLVEGNFKDKRGRIEAPIIRDSRNRKLFTVGTSGGKEAITDFAVAGSVSDFSLLDVSLCTGRTHQIRVHMKFIKHPIVGDQVYGSARSRKLSITRQWLHAYRLEFLHPKTDRTLSLSSKPPEALISYLEEIGIEIPPIF